jgi:hypothetical protein
VSGPRAKRAAGGEGCRSEGHWNTSHADVFSLILTLSSPASLPRRRRGRADRKAIGVECVGVVCVVWWVGGCGGRRAGARRCSL